MDKIEQLQKIIDHSSRIVFFGGAGVSTESGIPDYRSVDGLYHQKFKYPPEVMLSHTFFMSHTEEFYDFYRNKLLALDAKPNAAHLKLAELEKAGKLLAVITQNVDGLHQKAGSKNVYELHGSVHRYFCMDCHKPYTVECVTDCKGVPKCDCGGTIKPDVVLYEEGLDDSVIVGAINVLRAADTLIIGGTSLVVYPAAGLVNYFSGGNLVVINRESVPTAHSVTLEINDSIGKVLDEIEVR